MVHCDPRTRANRHFLILENLVNHIYNKKLFLQKAISRPIFWG